VRPNPEPPRECRRLVEAGHAGTADSVSCLETPPPDSATCRCPADKVPSQDPSTRSLNCHPIWHRPVARLSLGLGGSNWRRHQQGAVSLQWHSQQ
jgi:hypothetical protein